MTRPPARRQAIEGWLQRSGTSPVTRAPLTAGDLRYPLAKSAFSCVPLLGDSLYVK
jgi:hypothetical protein